MSVTGVPSLLAAFKTKIDEAVGLVPAMGAEDKLKAVQFWNVVSEKLQEIVNSSAADLNALALKMEKENAEKLTLNNQHSEFGSEFNAADAFGDAAQPFVPTEALIPGRNQLPYLSQHSLTTPSIQRSNHGLHPTVVLNQQSTAHLEDPNHNIIPCGNILGQEGFSETSDREEAFSSCAANLEKEKTKKRTLSRGQKEGSKKTPPKTKPKDGTILSGDKREGRVISTTENNGLKTILVIENDDDEIIEESGSEDVDTPDNDNMCSDEEDDDFDGENDEDDTILERECNRRSHPKKGPNGTYVCEYCNKEMITSSAFTSHRWVHTKPYCCAECNARFSTKGNLVVHQRRHTGEKPFVCDLCEARFSTNGNLKRHVKTHTGEKPWECSQCGHRFTEKKSLKVHMRRHTGEKPYECQVCGKKFAQTGILQTHMALHLDQKSHLCDNCGKSFRQRSQLRLHMLRHDGVKKYPCNSCPAKFLTKGDLERHHRVHTGERPFVCELCGKSFTRQQSLNEHMNRHYGLKPYQCKYCLKQFAEMSACYKHIKQHERFQNSQNPLENSPDCSSVNQTDLMNLHLPSDSNGDIIEVSESFKDDSEDQKYTVLVHTGEQPIEVTAEMAAGTSTILPSSDDQHITVTVEDHMVADFAAINLLANASSFQ